MRFPLRAKFFVFATLIATAPLALVGQNLVRIARDELKSAANEDLTGVAAGLASDFDTTVEGRWMTPLLVIRNGVDSDDARGRAEDLAPHPRPFADPRHRRAAAHASRARTCRSSSPTRTSPGTSPRPGSTRSRPCARRATPSPPSAATAATASCCRAGSRRPATGSPPSPSRYLQREGEALAPLEAAVAIDSNRAEYFRTLAHAAERLDQFDLLARCYRRVVWLDDEDGEAWFQIAAAEARRGRFGAADTAVAIAAELNPLRPGLFLLKGWISENLGQPDRASADLARQASRSTRTTRARGTGCRCCWLARGGSGRRSSRRG